MKISLLGHGKTTLALGRFFKKTIMKSNFLTINSLHFLRIARVFFAIPVRILTLMIPN